jgi:hypothetical protein
MGGSEYVAGVQAQPEKPSTPYDSGPISLKLFGGAEGYTGSLDHHLNTAAVYGLALGLDPWPFLGFELGYSGSAASLTSTSTAFLNLGSANVYRNGGYVLVKPGIPFPVNRAIALKLYLLGGVGVDAYSLNGTGVAALGYQSKTVGSAPFGGGLEFRAGAFVADARYNWTYDFSSFTTFQSSNYRWAGQLSVGVAF